MLHGPCLVAAAFPLLLAACSGEEAPTPGGQAPSPDGPELYDDSHLLDIEIEMDPVDWAMLGEQRRDIVPELVGDSCMSGPFTSPYTWFVADVSIDGERFESAGIRKKGLLGSESSTRPSLKLRLDKFVEQDWHGWTRLTLNNARQDPSFLRQCLAYRFFERAGLPASRCSFAHLRLNGEDLGLYVNVEPIGEDYLDRLFGEHEGSLYEGMLSDFREGWVRTFDCKSGPCEDGGGGELEAVVDALAATDGELLDTLDGVLELDEYLSFWAAEVLLGHWDGYNSDTNNFYVYARDGRLLFLPWGVDAVLDREDPFPTSGNSALVAHSALSVRLLGLEEGREGYLQALRGLLDGPWDEDALLSQLDRWSSLVGELAASTLDEEPADYETAVEELRELVEGRRARVEEGLAALEAGDWPEGRLQGYPCLEEMGRVSGSFSTTFGSLDSSDPFDEGSAELLVQIEGTEYPALMQAALAGRADEWLVLGFPYLVTSDVYLMPYFAIEEGSLVPGSLEVDWLRVRGYLGYAEGGGDLDVAAYLYRGSIELDEAGEEDGDPVAGRLDVPIYGVVEGR